MKRFTWWWPSSNAGNAAMWVILALSSLTFLIAGPFAIINVAFWYLVAIGVRFVYLQATTSAPSPRAPVAGHATTDEAAPERTQCSSQAAIRPRRDWSKAVDEVASALAMTIFLVIGIAVVMLAGLWAIVYLYGAPG